MSPERAAKRKRKPVRPAAGKVAGISDAAVRAATGHGWEHWLRALRRAGAEGWTHKRTAEWLHAEAGVPGWWAQMLTVGFERAVLGRAPGQKGDTFEVSGSKTLPVAAARIDRAFADARERKRWLGDESGLTLRKRTPGKSLRITWIDGASHVDVHLWPKGPGKAQVAVQHRKLPTAKAAAREKAAWKRRLAALAEHLAGGAAAPRERRPR